MKEIISLFPTEIYQSPLLSSPQAWRKLNREIFKDAYRLREHDREGQQWSKQNYRHGYTSYSSLSELFQVSSVFDLLRKKIDSHVQKYAQSLDVDLKQCPLEMTQMWINIMGHDSYHTSHLHPSSTVSGTYYVACPKDSGSIKFEDPRMQCFMGSAMRKTRAQQKNLRFVSIQAKEGTVLLFESWLKHEVTPNFHPTLDRVSVSFNYNWF